MTAQRPDLHNNEKLAKIIALWRSTEHEGERQSAREKAEALAKQLGMTFKEAFAADEKQNHRPKSMFDGFDESMEADQPGYKATKAREKAERLAAHEARLKALIERYGSAEAVLAPCERELMLRKAVERWRKPCDPPHERWTLSLGGFPEKVETALRNAYPLPETFAAARAEFDYWRTRESEIGDVLGDDYGGEPLDLPAYERLHIVEALIERELVVKTVADFLDRFKFFADRDWHPTKEDTRLILSDLERLVAATAHPSTTAAHPSAGADHPSTADQPSNAHPSTSTEDTSPSVHSGQIAAALKADPSRSDRSIAREFGCSPTSVGKVRASLGLADAPRSVRRGAQTFQARYPRGGAAEEKAETDE